MGQMTWHERVRGLRTWREASFAAANLHFDRGEGASKPIVIVLTIAHLDHVPENSADDNLRAFCQRHHLRHDLAHHKQTAYMTRKASARTVDMFGAG